MAEETGIVLPWEKDAMAGLEMPDGLSYPEQILYLSLRMLYRQYYQKTIDRETATKEKKKLLHEYKCYKYQDEMGKEWVDHANFLPLFFSNTSFPNVNKRLQLSHLIVFKIYPQSSFLV